MGDINLNFNKSKKPERLHTEDTNQLRLEQWALWVMAGGAYGVIVLVGGGERRL